MSKKLNKKLNNEFNISFDVSDNTIDYLIVWQRLITNDKRKKIRELRIKKINELNKISNDDKRI